MSAIDAAIAAAETAQALEEAGDLVLAAVKFSEAADALHGVLLTQGRQGLDARRRQLLQGERDAFRRAASRCRANEARRREKALIARARELRGLSAEPRTSQEVEAAAQALRERFARLQGPVASEEDLRRRVEALGPSQFKDGDEDGDDDDVDIHSDVLRATSPSKKKELSTEDALVEQMLAEAEEDYDATESSDLAYALSSFEGIDLAPFRQVEKWMTDAERNDPKLAALLEKLEEDEDATDEALQSVIRRRSSGFELLKQQSASKGGKEDEVAQMIQQVKEFRKYGATDEDENDKEEGQQDGEEEDEDEDDDESESSEESLDLYDVNGKKLNSGKKKKKKKGRRFLF